MMTDVMFRLPGKPYAREVKGVLTTEHSASSYGIPVLLIDGQPLGPGDLPDTAEMWFGGVPQICTNTVADIHEMYHAALRAGYPIAHPRLWRED